MGYKHIITYAQECIKNNKKEDFINNLKCNWYFPISEAAYFCLNIRRSIEGNISFIIAICIGIFIAGEVPCMYKKLSTLNKPIAIFSFFSAMGICIENGVTFNNYWKWHPLWDIVKRALHIHRNVGKMVACVGIVAAFVFVFIFTYLIINEVYCFFVNKEILKRLSTTEKIIYGIIILILLGGTVVAFMSSEVYYGTTSAYDIIYSSDSQSIVKIKTYVYLTQGQNDIRQPLFAIFAGPFVGIAYLLGRVFHASASVRAILLNATQIIMLVASNIILVSALKLKEYERISFVVLASCTYTSMLFSLMLEQYIVACFWLMIVIYQICEDGRPTLISINGAIGTLITNYIVLLIGKQKEERFRDFVKELIYYGIDFLILILAFCRFDVIYTLESRYNRLMVFTGRNVAFKDRIIQFSNFAHDMFLAPSAYASTSIDSVPVWRLSEIRQINIAGLIIICLVVLSGILNRKKKVSKLALVWFVFSIVMLVIIGWGTVENSLILYALYFGWAFYVLLFQLVKLIADTTGCRIIIPIFAIICSLLLLVFNIPAIVDIIEFGIQYYPV